MSHAFRVSKNVLRFQIATVLFSLAIFLFSPSVYASRPPQSLPSFSRILSYEELMRLSPRKRADYIHGLRLVFKEIEKKNSTSASAFDTLKSSQIAKILELYEQLVPAAEAQGKAGQPQCSGGLEPLIVTYFVLKDSSEAFVCAQPGSSMTACAGGYIGIRQDASGRFHCASESSFSKLNNLTKANSRKPNARLQQSSASLAAFLASGPSYASLLTSNLRMVQRPALVVAQRDVVAPGLPYRQENAIRCGNGLLAVRPSAGPGGRDVGSTNPDVYVCISKERGREACRPGTIAIKQDDEGRFNCATIESFSRLALSAKVEARRPNVRFVAINPLVVFQVKETGRRFAAGEPSYESLSRQHPNKTVQAAAAPLAGAGAKSVADGATSKPIQSAPTKFEPPKLAYDRSVFGDSAVTSGTKPTVARPAARRVPLAVKPQPTAPGASAAPSEAGTTGGSGSSALSDPSSILIEASAEADQPKAILVVPVPTEKVTDDLSLTEPAAPAPETSPDLTSCSSEIVNAPKCDGEAVEAARRKYVSDANPDCIYAGSVTTYAGGQKQSYRCDPPHAFCFGSRTCKTDLGDSMKADYTCAASQVICNPLLFGVHADGRTPFCVRRDANATARCDETAAAETRAVQPLDQSHAGIREAWNDFADRVFKLCHSNEIAKTLHCDECQIVRKRLFDLNVAARDIQSCGAAIKYEASNCLADGLCHGRPATPAKPATSPARAVGSVLQDEVVTETDRKPAAHEIRH